MSEETPSEGEGRVVGSPVGGGGSPLEAPGKVSLYAPGTKVRPEALSGERRVLADLGCPGPAPDLAPKGSFAAWCAATSEWDPEWQRWASFLFLGLCVEKVTWSEIRFGELRLTSEANSARLTLDSLRCWALCPCAPHLRRFELPKELERYTTSASPVHNRRAWHAFQVAHRAARGGEADLLPRVGPAVGNVIRPAFLLAKAREAMIPVLLGKQPSSFASPELRADSTFKDYVRSCIWSSGCKSCGGWNLRLSGTHTQVNPASGDSFIYTRVACRSCNHSVEQSWEA